MRTKTVIKWTALVLLLAYTVSISVWASARAKEMVCKKIEVTILNPSNSAPLTKKGVEEEIKKFDATLIGKPVTMINTRNLESHLSKAGNFESVECTMTSMGTLRVNVIQMIPVLRVFDKSGSYYINRDGKVLKSSHEFYHDVPIVYGNFSKELRPTIVLPIVRKIQQDNTLRNLIVMLKVDSPTDIMASTRIAGHVVNLGDTTNLDEKFKNLMMMYHKVLPMKGWTMYDTISVKFKGQVVATRANKAPILHSQPYEEEGDPEEEAFMQYAESQGEGHATPTKDSNKQQ